MAPAPSYSVVDPGSGQVIRNPLINEYGQVACNPGAAAFFYDGAIIIPIPGLNRSRNATATGLIDIGTLGGGSRSEARAVDERGKIAGKAIIANGRSHAFFRTRSGGSRGLGSAGGVASSVLGMTAPGRIAGSVRTGRGRDHAMTWTQRCGMQDIGALPAGLTARAWAADDHGQVIGESDQNQA